MGVSHLAPSNSADGWYMYIPHFTNKKGTRAKRHLAIIEGFLKEGTLVIVNSQKRPFSKKPFNCFRVFQDVFFAVPSDHPRSLLLSKVVNLNDKKKNYRIYSINHPGRLLIFWTLRVGAYSRWALFRGWALIKFSPFSASEACLFCNKTINDNNKTPRNSKARFL